MGTEVIQCLFLAPPVLSLSPSLPPSDPDTVFLGGGGSICVCCWGWMGYPASRAEDDSLGCGPGTLGKARPASGQGPRELGDREKGAGHA